MSASFEITGAPADGLDGLGRVALGPWRPRSTDTVPVFSGTIGYVSESVLRQRDHIECDAGPCWQVDFTGTHLEAGAALDAGARSVAEAAARLDALPLRLDQTMRERATPTSSPDVLVDFAIDAGEAAGVEGTLRRILGFALVHARVETRVRGVLYARSVMSLSGDTQVVLARGLDPELACLHARAVSLAVRSRDLWVRLVATVFQASARIAAAGLGPAGMATALPLVWRLTRRVLADVQHLRQVHAAHADTDQTGP